MRIQNCTKQGMRIELPASYPTNPPTPAMKRLVAVNRATLILEHMIEAKQKEMSRLTIRQDEVGGRPIEGTLEDIEGYRRSLVVRKILGSLTGSIGGSFGFLVGGLLTDNPEKIAAASAMGNTIVGTFSSARALNPGTSTRGLPKAKHSYSLRSIRKTRQTPAKNKTREADAKRTIVNAPDLPPVRGRTVLGHYPEYISRATELAARRFNIPAKIWSKMSPTKQWAANQTFLDRMIRRGDDVVLATRASNARLGSFYARELEYLASKGYHVAKNGMSMIAPRR